MGCAHMNAKPKLKWEKQQLSHWVSLLRKQECLASLPTSKPSLMKERQQAWHLTTAEERGLHCSVLVILNEILSIVCEKWQWGLRLIYPSVIRGEVIFADLSQAVHQAVKSSPVHYTASVPDPALVLSPLKPLSRTLDLFQRWGEGGGCQNLVTEPLFRRHPQHILVVSVPAHACG